MRFVSFSNILLFLLFILVYYLINRNIFLLNLIDIKKGVSFNNNDNKF